MLREERSALVDEAIDDLMLKTVYAKTEPVLSAFIRFMERPSLDTAWNALRVEGPPAQGTLDQDWQLNPDPVWRHQVERWLDRYNGTTRP